MKEIFDDFVLKFNIKRIIHFICKLYKSRVFDELYNSTIIYAYSEMKIFDSIYEVLYLKFGRLI